MSLYSISINKANIDLTIKAEAFYPFLQGGSKARKLKYILEHAKTENANAIVSAGSASSNHARDCALAAAQLGWKCTLIIHDKADAVTNNLFLMRLAGAELIFCDMADVAEKMDQAMLDFRAQGLNPYYIWGGGHSVYGTLALYDAAKEFVNQSKAWLPDYVVVASGTGGTQAGLHLGFAEASPSTKVIGISVARNAERGTKAVENAVTELKAFLKLEKSVPSIAFYDDWVGEGYGCASSELVAHVNDAAHSGVLLDTTYTGKAWQGMYDLVKRGDISKGAKVLFWHTGGIFNLLDQKNILDL